MSEKPTAEMAFALPTTVRYEHHEDEREGYYQRTRTLYGPPDVVLGWAAQLLAAAIRACADA